MRLKTENPDAVFMVRGNHEDIQINEYMATGHELMGFSQELHGKGFADHIDTINKLYTSLPSVVYISCQDAAGAKNVLQCNHGGLEFGFDPIPLLASGKKQAFMPISHLARKESINSIAPLKRYIDEHPGLEESERADITPTNPYDLGFLWNDFIVDEDKEIEYTEDRGFAIGKRITEAFLQKQSTDAIKLRGIFRGHQHSRSKDDPLMNLLLNSPDGASYDGIAKLWQPQEHANPSGLWDSIVCTLAVAPFTPYGVAHQFYYDTFAILKFEEAFKDWSLSVQHSYAQSIQNQSTEIENKIEY